VVYSAMDIDVWEVINAAKTKPFGFMPFYPGPGLGGHCIPIDPFYLTWKAREYGQNTKFIELAGEINTAMPQYVVNRLADALNSQRKAINGSKVLIVGLAYKPNVDDERESPSYVLMDLLKHRGAEVAYYDPYVPVVRPSGNGRASAATTCRSSPRTMPASTTRSWPSGRISSSTPAMPWRPSRPGLGRCGRPNHEAPACTS
jgi:nucleotide sugar dehydrogenase